MSSIFSHSKLKTFDQCGWKFRLEYLDRLRLPDESIEIYVGHRVHEALEEIYRGWIERREMPVIEAVLAGYHTAWDRHWHDAIYIVRTGTPVATYRANGERFLRDYLKRHLPFDPATEHSVAVEQEMRFPVDATRGWIMRCIMDRVVRRPDGVWEIHDYKTAASMPRQDDFHSDKPGAPGRQLALYQLVLQSVHPDARQVELKWHYLAHDTVFTSTRTPEQISALHAEVLVAIARVEAAMAEPEKLAPKESALCAWCQYAGHCPARKHVYQVRQLGPEQRRADHGVRLVDGYVQGLSKGLRGTPEEVTYRQRLLRYAEHHSVFVLEGSSKRVRIRGDHVALEDVSGADRRC